MKARVWAFLFSLFLVTQADAQQLAFLSQINALATNSPTQVAEIRINAEKGDPAVQLLVAWQYGVGIGVTKDYSEAAKWARKAAEHNNPDAQVLLGGFYMFGKGVPQDYTKSVMWVRKAVAQGNASAQQALG